MKKFTAQITPTEEITELQLAVFKRHKRNGTTPGNPKWYRPQVIRPFVPQLSVRVPSLGTGQDWHTAHSQSREDPFAKARGFEGADYVLAYERALGLRPQDAKAAAAFARMIDPQPQRRAA